MEFREYLKIMFANYYAYAKSLSETEKNEDALTAFDMTSILAICFAMKKEDVMDQYINYVQKISKEDL